MREIKGLGGGKQGKTLSSSHEVIAASPKQAFALKLLEKLVPSTKAGQPSDERDLQRMA